MQPLWKTIWLNLLKAEHTHTRVVARVSGQKGRYEPDRKTPLTARVVLENNCESLLFKIKYIP